MRTAQQNQLKTFILPSNFEVARFITTQSVKQATGFSNWLQKRVEMKGIISFVVRILFGILSSP